MNEIIAEWKGKLNSIKVCPFVSANPAVKYEMTWIGDLTGRLKGVEIGTDYLTIAADGTGVGDYYGVITTAEGETVLVEGHGTATPIKDGRMAARFAIRFRTASSQLSWLNTFTAAFESEGDLSGDLSSKVLSGRYVEWK